MTRLTMRVSVMLVAVTVAAPASAAVFWDGIGSPNTVGFTLTGNPSDFFFNTLGNGTENFDQGANPGSMYQFTGSETGSWSLTGSAAANELVRATGWRVDIGVQAFLNDGDRFGLYVVVGDNQGSLGALLKPTGVEWYNGDWGTYPTPTINTVADMATTFNKVSWTMAPGATQGQVWLNDVLQGSITPFAGGSPRVIFGDGSGGASGRANYDYVRIEGVPEPSALTLLAALPVGLAGYVAVRWRRCDLRRRAIGGW